MNLLQQLLNALLGLEEHIIDVPVQEGQTPEDVIRVMRQAAEEAGVVLTSIEIIEVEEP